MNSTFLAPIFGMVALTTVVWAIAVQRRVQEIRARRIPVQSLARASDTAAALKDSSAMDNFNNLLQLPILFYVLCLAFVLVGEDSSARLAGAWAYVALRLVHSVIQITYNRVLHRFYVWTLGNSVLFSLWAVFAIERLRSIH